MSKKILALILLTSLNVYSSTEYSIKDTVWERPQTTWRYIYSGSADDFCKFKGHLDGSESYQKDHLTLEQVDGLKIYHKFRNLETILFYIVEENESGIYEIGTFGKRRTAAARVYTSIICKD